MEIMNRYIIVIGVSLLVLSCDNGKGGKINEPYSGGHGIGIDTETVDSIAKMELQVSKEENIKEQKSTVSSGSYSSSSSAVDDDDNMRGWDPASEDDMDDNGMSRYMENTDDEGWD
jgi:hypothetical protein